MKTRPKLLIEVSLIFLIFFVFPSVLKAQEASLFLSPGSKAFVIGEVFSVEVKVDTNGTPINAAEGIIFFPAENLEVVNISKDDSIFTLWPEELEYSNDLGEISFSGGVPHPGFNGVGKIITINFQAKSKGTIDLILGESRVLADDGKGTDILIFIKEAKYFIKEEIDISEFQLELQPGQPPPSPKIICLTHPYENDWYSNRNPVFQWVIIPEITGVSFILDQKFNTTPDNISEGFTDYKTYENLIDGTWYFHLRIENEFGWSDTAHYQTNIDANPPSPFEIIIDNAGDVTNPQPNLYFETTDEISGVNYYKFKIGEEKFSEIMLAQINPLSLPVQLPGHYLVIVRAVDMAGNNVESHTVLDIEPIASPQITIWPKVYLPGEELFYIEGTALPNNEITISLKENEQTIKKWQVFSNEWGEWSFSTKELIKSGVFYLTTQARDERGAISEITEPKEIEARFNGLILGSILISFRQLSFISLLILFLVILISGFLIYLNLRSRKALRKETNEVKESVRVGFEELRKEIEKKIQMLDAKPGFNEEERKLYEDLRDALISSREIISKEIEDVVRGLK